MFFISLCFQHKPLDLQSLLGFVGRTRFYMFAQSRASFCHIMYVIDYPSSITEKLTKGNVRGIRFGSVSWTTLEPLSSENR